MLDAIIKLTTLVALKTYPYVPFPQSCPKIYPFNDGFGKAVPWLVPGVIAEEVLCVCLDIIRSVA